MRVPLRGDDDTIVGKSSLPEARQATCTGLRSSWTDKRQWIYAFEGGRWKVPSRINDD